jgi:hypothetical protein
MFEVLKWAVYGLVVLVILPYTAIAVVGMVVGVYRQFKPAQGDKASISKENEA